MKTAVITIVSSVTIVVIMSGMKETGITGIIVVKKAAEITIVRTTGRTREKITEVTENVPTSAGITTGGTDGGTEILIKTIRMDQTVENVAETIIHSHERLDELHRNGYRIIQDKGRFCFGMDAVLLSGFAKVKPDEQALDLGTGTGIIPILLEAKTDGRHFVGLEIQEESADMASRSVAYNGLEEKIEIVTGDIKDASNIFGASSFDVITTNPPYMIGQHGLKNEENAKAIARHEILCTLDDVLRESAKILKPGGRFYMVHRPFRLAEILSAMVQYRIEPKRMRLVYPFVDKEPNMVLIEGLRGGRSRMTVEKPLIVYKEPGVYTDEIYDIYGY